MARQLYPIGKNVLIILDAREAQSSGGIFIPDAAQKPVQWGEVVEAGEAVQQVTQGSRVLLQPHAGYRYEAGGRDYIVVAEKCILAVERSLDTPGN